MRAEGPVADDAPRLSSLLPRLARKLLAAPIGGVRPAAGEALARIGEALDVPWIQLHLLVGEDRAEPVCEYTAPADPPRFTPRPQVGFRFEDYSWMIERALRLEPVQVHTDELPDEAEAERARMQAEGVAWLLAVPSGDSRGPRGGMLLHDDRRRDFLGEEEVDLLVLAAGLFVQALERERAERALVQSERRYRTLADATTEAILVQSGGRLLDVNDAACRLFGYPRAELLLQPSPGNLAWGGEGGKIRARIARRNEEPYETAIRTADGERVPVLVNARHYDRDGRDVRIVAMRDLRERKLAEARLRESAARMRALLEAAFEGFVVSRRGFVLDANEGFARMCGYDLPEVIGMLPSDVTTPAGAATILDNIRDEVHVPYVVTGVRKDGSTFPMQIQGTECYFEGERVRITGFRDLTREYERDRLEERVRQAQKLESLAALAGGIAHDFNNLLVGVLGNTDVVEAALPEGSPERQAAEQIRTAAVRAAEMVRQMLAYAGQGGSEEQTVDLGQLVDEMRRLTRTSLPSSVEVELVFPDDLPAVRGDAVQLRQVVMNLLTNAAEAAVDGGKRVRVTADSVSVTDPPPGLAPSVDLRPGDYVRMTVEDNGPGMDEAVRTRMFDPFFSTKFTGRGLGLASVLGIARSHRGGIAVRSVPGRGTRIELFLQPSEEPKRPEATTVSLRTARAQATVLLVDDEELVRKVAKAALERAGHRVLVADSGQAGLELFRARGGEIDVVLLDLAMPGMSGVDVFAHIRSEDPDLPVLFSSGYLDSELGDAAQDDPRVAFLQKPYRASALTTAIARLLDG